MPNQNYVKIATPIRTIRSDVGQVKISLFNDQISLSFQPATQQKTDYGGIKYNGSPNIAPNVRFSVGVASSIAKLIRDKVVPACDNGQPVSGHWEVYACKRNTYESWVNFDVNGGKITMTGVEVSNGVRKQASYNFPQTVIMEGQNQITINGEALAFAELLSEIGGSNEMPAHMRQYNQALKDNFPNAGQQNAMMNQQQPQQGNQFMNTWRPN